MTGKPGMEYNKRDIPYPANTPQYNKYWRLTSLAGKTHEEAMEIMKTWVPGKKKKSSQQAPQVPATQPPDKPVLQKKEEKAEASPSSQPPPLPETTLEKQLIRLNTTLYQISKCLERIADKIAPEPGYEGTVTLAPKMQTGGATTPSSVSVRQTANGLIVGDNVIWTARGETGKIIRILPGKKDAEVKFGLGIGTKTLPVDRLEPAPASAPAIGT